MREGRNGGKLNSGNTKNVGRKRELPELSKLLAEVLGEEKDGITAGEAILKALRAKATKGDVRAAEVLLDRAYGKPKQTSETTLKTTEPLVIIKTKEDNA
jgi:orotate phosphoribosyltransferase